MIATVSEPRSDVVIVDVFELKHVPPTVEALLGETLTVRAKREGNGPKPWPNTPAQCRTPPHVMERRRKVAGMLADGLSQAEIARRLGLSPSAISHDLTEIRKARGA